MHVGALAMVGVLGFAVTAYVALRTSLGLRLDRAASDAVSSPTRVLSHFDQGLALVTLTSVGLALLACVTLALVQHRLDLALGAVVVIAGANISTQILKYKVVPRFDLSDIPNGFPSGHATVALSIALAAVIVAPSAWRSTVAIGVTATAALMGVALVLGRYHRPASVIAATFVCLGWAAAGLLAAELARNRLPSPAPTGGAWVHLGALVGASLASGLLLAWGVKPEPGLRDLGLGILSLGSVVLACAGSIAVVAHLADRHLG